MNIALTMLNVFLVLWTVFTGIGWFVLPIPKWRTAILSAAFTGVVMVAGAGVYVVGGLVSQLL